MHEAVLSSFLAISLQLVDFLVGLNQFLAQVVNKIVVFRFSMCVCVCLRIDFCSSMKGKRKRRRKWKTAGFSSGFCNNNNNNRKVQLTQQFPQGI